MSFNIAEGNSASEKSHTGYVSYRVMKDTEEKTSTLVTGTRLSDSIQNVSTQIYQITMTMHSHSPQKESAEITLPRMSTNWE